MGRVAMLVTGWVLVNCCIPAVWGRDYEAPLDVQSETLVLWHMDTVVDNGSSARVEDAENDSDKWLMLNPYPNHPATLTTSVSDALDDALVFDGVDDYGQTRRTIWANYPTVRVEGWIKPGALSGLQFITHSYSWRVFLQDDELRFTAYFSDGTNDTVLVDLDGAVNEWEHFTACFSADGKLILRTLSHGQAESISPGKQLRDGGSDQDIQVGCEGAGVRRFYQGAIDELRISVDDHQPLGVQYDTVGLWHMDAVTDNGSTARITDAESDSDKWLMLYPYPNHPATLVSSVSTPLDQALQFDGVDDYGQTRRAIWKNAPTVMIEGWIKPYTLSGLQFIAHANSWRVFLQDDDLRFTAYFSDATNRTVLVDLDGAVNQWEHFRAYFDVDGNQVLETYYHGSASATELGKQLSDAGSDQYINIGSEGAGVRRFYQGLIDELRVSDVSDYVFDRQQDVLEATFAALHNSSTNPKVHAMRAYAAYELKLRDPCAVTQNDLDRANDLLVDINANYSQDADTYWILPLLAQIAGDADYRQYLDNDALAACKELLFDDYHKSYYARTDAATTESNIWNLRHSDNHDIMRRVTAYLTAQFLKNVPNYASLLYDDGGTPAQHHAEWADFFPAYFRERARKGPQVEIASTTYTGVQLYPVFALYDSAETALVRDHAGKYLDLYFGDAAVECVGGIRGGAKTRVYKYLYGGVNKFERYGWILTGLPADVSVSIPFEGYPGLSTTYRLPVPVHNLFAQDQQRGSYEYLSSRPGQGTHTTHDGHPWYDVVFPSDIRRVTYTTPEYVLGTFTVDEDGTYTAIHTQNPWMGLIGADDPDSLLYFTTEMAGTSGKNHRDLQAVQYENAAILRCHNEIMNDQGFKVYMSDGWTQQVDASGWLFGTNSDSSVYYAIYATDPNGSGVRYEIGSAAPDADGTWVQFAEKDTLAVMEAAVASDYASFTAFQDDIENNTKSWNGTNEFQYTACNGALLTFYRDKTLPKVDGQTVDLNPDRTYNCIYLATYFAGDVVTVTDYLGNPLILDFDY